MISYTHLKKHGITGSEYKVKFPGFPLRIQTEEIRNKSSNSKKGKPAWNKGIPTSEEQKEKQSLTMREKYKSGELIHWNTGLTHSEETKNQISETCSKYVMTEEQHILREHKKLQWRESESYIPPMFGKRHSLEIKRKIKLNQNPDLIRQTMEQNGYWVPLNQIPEFVKYKRLVWRETNKNTHKLPNYDPLKRGRCSLTQNTYQIDHKLSIYEGFKEGISPDIIGHVLNLEFLPWKDNLRKWTKSSITKEELVNLINNQL